MDGYVLILLVASVLFAGVITYAVSRRYGWKPALILPLLALGATIAMLWQEQGAGLQDGLGLALSSVMFAAPTLVGALAGIFIARLHRS